MLAKKMITFVTSAGSIKITFLIFLKNQVKNLVI